MNVGGNCVQQTQIVTVDFVPDWQNVLEDIIVLRKMTNSKTMQIFANEAEAAAKENNWERFKVAAKKIGEFGLEFLREASIATLATLATKALLG